MEFLVIVSRFKRQPERERIVMQAVIEASEAVGAERILVRRGNVYSTGVYVNDGKENAIVYNDWDKEWNWKRIYEHIISSVHISPVLRQEYQICLTA